MPSKRLGKSYKPKNKKKIQKLKRKDQLSKLAKNAAKSRVQHLVKKRFEKIENSAKAIILNLCNQVNTPTEDYLCNHVLVGSSLFSRLIKGNYLLKRMHRASKFIAANALGNLWEDFTKQQTSIFVEDEWVDFKVTSENTFRISKEFPFLCATPDIVIDLKKKEERYALLEVKSTSSKDSFNEMLSADSSAVFQLRAALEVFNLKKGILVIYLVKAPRPRKDATKNPATKHTEFDEKQTDQDSVIYENDYESLEEKIIHSNARWIFRDKLFSNYKEEIINNYSDYLTSIAIFPVADKKNFKRSVNGYSQMLDWFRPYARSLVEKLYVPKDNKEIATTKKELEEETRVRITHCPLRLKMKRLEEKNKPPRGRPKLRHTGTDTKYIQVYVEGVKNLSEALPKAVVRQREGQTNSAILKQPRKEKRKPGRPPKKERTMPVRHPQLVQPKKVIKKERPRRGG